MSMFDKAKLAVVVAGLALGAPIAQSGLSYAQDGPAVREIEVVVEGGYKPKRVEVRKGERIRLRFVRKEHGSCTREVVFPKLGIRRELPTNQPVVIELPALEPGEYEFKCGMNMIKGAVVVMP
jgi:plastocyanin domain-containing protein